MDALAVLPALAVLITTMVAVNKKYILHSHGNISCINTLSISQQLQSIPYDTVYYESYYSNHLQEKTYSFLLLLQLHNYIGLSWCDYCRNFMWGLRNQGYRCKGGRGLIAVSCSPYTLLRCNNWVRVFRKSGYTCLYPRCGGDS